MVVFAETKLCPKCGRPSLILWKGKEYCFWCDAEEIDKLGVGKPIKTVDGKMTYKYL